VQARTRGFTTASLVVGLLVAGIGIPLVFALLYNAGAKGLQLHDSYWQALFAAWLATSLGILTGFPGALAVSHLASNASRQREIAGAALARTTRQRLVRQSARTELTQAQTQAASLAQGHLEYFANPSFRLQAVASEAANSELLGDEVLTSITEVAFTLDFLQQLGLAWLTSQHQTSSNQSGRGTGALLEEIMVATGEDAARLASRALALLDAGVE
jgi:hypothetical protein